jgi:Undecaprenyl-phosphate glucose phosphotransferase
MSSSLGMLNPNFAKAIQGGHRQQYRPGWLSTIVINGMIRASYCIVIVISAFLAHKIYNSSSADIDLIETIVIIAGLMLGFYIPIVPTYSYVSRRLFRLYLGIFKQWTFISILIFMLASATRTGRSISQEWIAIWFVCGLFGLLAISSLIELQLRRWRRQGLLATNIVVVGAGSVYNHLVQHLACLQDDSIRLIGLFHDDEVSPPEILVGDPAIDARDELIGFARSNQIDQVIVALPWHAETRLGSWLTVLRALPADILLCPPTISLCLSASRTPKIGSIPLLRISERPISGWNYVIKAAEDRLLGLFLLVLSCPVMLLIACAIRLDSPGPVIFRQTRHGFNNSLIEVLKFRTMYIDTTPLDLKSVTQATRHDHRVTRVGRWLRRTSLDELPQLINVVCGQMSLVGPRPHAVAHNEQYQKRIEAYLARHRVKPGITGWAQVNGFRGETNTEEKMIRRVELDLYYIDHWSLSFDLSIMIRTAFVGFIHPNAY